MPLKLARSHGYAVSYSRVYAGDALPLTTDGIDLLIVLGGPQSPSTTVGECAYFNAEAEKNLIARAISAGRAVVGVCLGSQLIGEALGAKYESSPHKEIGKFPINLTEAGHTQIPTFCQGRLSERIDNRRSRPRLCKIVVVE